MEIWLAHFTKLLGQLEVVQIGSVWRRNLDFRKILFSIIAIACCRLLQFVAYRFHSCKIFELHSSIKNILSSSHLDIETDLLINSLVVAEDHRFFFHDGIDPYAIFRASIKTLSGQVQGASTIEQQLVRTITKDYEKTLRRKIREALLASTLRRKFTKCEVAWAYLLIAYWGDQNQKRGNHQELLGAHSDLIAALSLMSQLKYPARRDLSGRNSLRRKARTVYLVNRLRQVGVWLPNPISINAFSVDSSTELFEVAPSSNLTVCRSKTHGPKKKGSLSRSPSSI